MYREVLAKNWQQLICNEKRQLSKRRIQRINEDVINGMKTDRCCWTVIVIGYKHVTQCFAVVKICYTWACTENEVLNF
jgi:hypothetical protein